MATGQKRLAGDSGVYRMMTLEYTSREKILSDRQHSFAVGFFLDGYGGSSFHIEMAGRRTPKQPVHSTFGYSILTRLHGEKKMEAAFFVLADAGSPKKAESEDTVVRNVLKSAKKQLGTRQAFCNVVSLSFAPASRLSDSQNNCGGVLFGINGQLEEGHGIQNGAAQIYRVGENSLDQYEVGTLETGLWLLCNHQLLQGLAPDEIYKIANTGDDVSTICTNLVSKAEKRHDTGKISVLLVKVTPKKY